MLAACSTCHPALVSFPPQGRWSCRFQSSSPPQVMIQGPREVGTVSRWVACRPHCFSDMRRAKGPGLGGGTGVRSILSSLR